MAKNLFARSALETSYHIGDFGIAHINGPGVSVKEIINLNLFNIDGDSYAPDFFQIVTSVIQCDLPVLPNTTSESKIAKCLWLSPNRWLVTTSKNIFPDLFSSNKLFVSDVSSGRTIIRISGSKVRHVLSKGCPLDFHPSSFGTGRCAQSTINSLNILIALVNEQTFDIFVARGFALSFWQWLKEASLEYGLRVETSSATQ